MIDSITYDTGRVDSNLQLKRKKQLALGCLIVATALFLAFTFSPQTFLIRLFKAGAEAAMVGGLADWFAVVALFRRPLGLPIPHTAIVPQSKNRIAESLATFVKEKFLAPELLVSLIQRTDPVQLGARWLTNPGNSQRVAQYISRLMGYALKLLGEDRIQAFIKDAAHAAVSKINISESLGAILDMLTKGGRHQELLDAILEHIQKLIGDSAIRDEIVSRVIHWFKGEYPKLEKIVPDSAIEWLGEKTANAMQEGLKDYLGEIAAKPTHELRKKVDDAIATLIVKLKKDSSFIAKLEDVKKAFLKNPEFHDYITGLWIELRDWLTNDLSSSQSKTRESLSGIGLWMGENIMRDKNLRDSINEHLQSFAKQFAPDFADFLTDHIRETIAKWDEKKLSDQIELGIGADLQFIRMSGTGVGFIVGILIFFVSDFIQHL